MSFTYTFQKSDAGKTFRLTASLKSNPSVTDSILIKGEKDPATAKIIETTLSSTGWNKGQYTLTSDLIKANNYISISFGKNISLEQYDCLAKAKVICVTQIDGQIILKSLGTVPNIDIPIIIVIEEEQTDIINNSMLLTDDTTGETYKVGIDNDEMYSAKL